MPLAAVARAVYRADNVLSAGLVVVLTVSPGGGLVDFDAGRAAQSMMLSAWADGVACCPNGVADPDALHRALGITAPDRAVVVLSFGAPATPRDPARRTPGAVERPGPAPAARGRRAARRSGRP